MAALVTRGWRVQGGPKNSTPRQTVTYYIVLKPADESMLFRQIELSNDQYNIIR